MHVLTYLWDWVVPFLVVLTVLVFIHELGHFLVARRCKVRVETFSIGFGPELWGFTDKSGTRWKFSVVPLGGYVKMFGESAEEEEAEAPLSEADRAVSFHYKTLRQRSAIVAAGPAANFIFAFAVLFAVFAVAGLPTPLAAVGSVIDGTAAARSGFEAGDRILAIDDKPMDTFDDVRAIVAASANHELSFSIERAGQHLQILATPEPTHQTDGAGTSEEIGLLGIRPDPDQMGFVSLNPLSAFAAAAERTWSLGSQIVSAIGQIITGARTTEELGGPLRIAQLSGQVAQDGVLDLVFFMAALSVNLGLVNLLPIPMLDGGHLIFYGLEGLRGRPVNKRVQEYSFRLGLAFVLFLMILATWNDLVSLKILDFFKNLVS